MSPSTSCVPVLLAAAVALVAATGASAYDYGCQNLWTGPDMNNDITGCVTSIPTNDPGVLVPPIIPMAFIAFMLLIFPASFICRRFGACGSNKARPGADCCCDGEEWDAVPDEEKLPLYPPGNVRCIKCASLIVVILAIFPVILMIVGVTYGRAFWNDFYAIMSTDVLDWAAKLESDFENDLRLPDGSFVAPLTNDTFAGFGKFIDDAQNSLDNLNDVAVQHFDLIFRFIIGVACIPLVLLSFLLLFILCNIRKILPTMCASVYFTFSMVSAVLCTFAMLFGVIFVLTCGEVTLNQFGAPGVVQWYAVPLCEEKIFFNQLKVQFNIANHQAALAACTALTSICDDLPFGVTDVPGVSSKKPFLCDLTTSNVESLCPVVPDAADFFNSTYVKVGTHGAICDNCTIGTCPEKCTEDHVKTVTANAREKLSEGLRVVKALDRAFIYADCDVLIARLLRPFSGCNSASVGMFLAASGAGIAALLLMFGIVLMLKGQKLFFPRDMAYTDSR